MMNRHLDALYITRPVSIAYLTGLEANPHERLMALAVRGEGATLIVPALEEERARGRATNADVVAWRDGEDAYELVTRELAGFSEVGVEKDHLSLHAAEVITSRTSVSELVDVGPEIKRLRLIKNDDEIAKLQRAAVITDQAYELVISKMRAGQTEVDVALLLASAIGDLGGTLSFPTLIQSGPNSSLPHLEPSSRRLSAGDLVLLDFGAAFGGYKADTTRMAVVGANTEKHREIHELVLAGARGVIERGGYGKEFFHRVGHGLGLEGHEDPSLDPGSDTLLEEGMVFTIEPGVYIPGWGGVRIEDDVVVQGGGCHVLTQANRSLRVIPSK